MDTNSKGTPHQPLRKQTRPTILQWNCNSVKQIQQNFTIFCYQKTTTSPASKKLIHSPIECSLPGYVGQNRAMAASTRCLLACCNDSTHSRGHARAAIHVWRKFPHAGVDFTRFLSDHLECVAVTMQMGAVETMEVNAYEPPTENGITQSWAPSTHSAGGGNPLP